MIGDGIGLVRDIISLKKAKQNAAIATHNRVAAQQIAGTLSDTTVETAKLYSFKGENLLREEAFWIVFTPIAFAAFFPNFVHQCVQNVTYAVPDSLLKIMGYLIITIYGGVKLKDILKG